MVVPLATVVVVVPTNVVVVVLVVLVVVDVVVVGPPPPPLDEIVIDSVRVAGCPLPSVAVTLNPKVLLAVGVPLMSPPLDRFSPPGRAPEVTAQV